MKYRSGFVSNSSSSSFVSYADSAFDIAKQMIPLREWKNDDRLLEILDAIREEIDCDSIMFSSCNYDTYIAKMGDKFIIHTCNNHSFWDVDCLDEIGEDSKEDVNFDGIEFFDLERQIYFKTIDYEDKPFDERWCDKHYSHIVEITRGEFTGQHVCPGCINEDKKDGLVLKMAVDINVKSIVDLVLSNKATKKDIKTTMKKIKKILMKEIKNE